MTKQKEPDRPGTQLLNSVKSKVKKQQKETNMKNLKNNQTFKTVMHFVLTLLTLAVIGGLVFTGWALRGNYEHNQDAYIQSVVDAKVSAQAPKVEASK